MSQDERLEIATRVTEIWSRAIGRPIPHDQSNTYFYALGGHHHLAVRVISEINRSFGLSLVEHDLDGEYWTISKFTDLIFLQVNGSERSTVVPLRAIQGSRPPLFIVHGVGGNVVGFHSLAKHLEADLPVYGIQAQGLVHGRDAVLRVQEMAAQHIGDMRVVAPEGPYNLLGYSYGGLVAYEIAQQLRAAGHEVGFLGMLDTRQPLHYTSGPSWTTLHRWIYSRLSRAVYTIYHRNDRARYLLRRLKAHALRIRYSRNLDKGVVQVSATARDVAAINFAAGLHYTVRSYPGEVVLFRVEEDNPLERRLPLDLGWHQYAGQLTVKLVPGAHVALIEEPGLTLLAAEITSAMEECKSGRQKGSTQQRRNSQELPRVVIEI